jgi:hypothetical protein
VSDWLIVLIPLLVAPVVLLLAFTGCGAFGAAPGPEDTPKEPEPIPEPTPEPDPPKKSTPVPDPQTYPELILSPSTPGLHCYWRLDDASGLQATDSGPLKRHGTYSGGVTPGTAAGALQPKVAGDRATVFNGSSHYVNVPFDANVNPTSFSVEAWIRPSTTQYEAVISSWQLTPTVVQGFELGLQAPDVFRARIGTGTSFAVLEQQVPTSPPNPPVQAVWNHVVLTYDATTGVLVLYRNGSPIATDTLAYTPNVSGSEPLRIGAGRLPFQPTNTNPANFFTGTIDEVALYGVALQAPEVAKHFMSR